ncbi:MAG: OB-fold domain-containing protein [Acidimicrobiia bacterium]|nr:OB-fold domain-containing protein [Acidimicrobiia bacterium]
MREIVEAGGLPLLTPVNEAWFTSGEVAIQCCASCTTLQHPPEEVCHACGGTEFEIRVLRPRGTVVSHTVVHHAPSPALAAFVPYTIVLVSLDDAPHIRVVGNIDGPVSIGMRVAAHWEEFPTDEGPTIRLIQWHRMA